MFPLGLYEAVKEKQILTHAEVLSRSQKYDKHSFLSLLLHHARGDSLKRMYRTEEISL